MSTKGYKVFNPDWTCRGFQYEVGKTYEEDAKPVICRCGFHFCEKVADCFCYYEFSPINKVAEVLALGDIDTDGKKSCTNKIQIVREIPWTELLELVNIGEDNSGRWNSGNRNSGDQNSGDCNSGCYNSGDYNSGHYNSGHYNSGDWNSGDYNSGHYNSGDWNSGDYNSGDWNSGHYNSGHYNSGDWNSGHYNSGDWNRCSWSNGCFNTVESKIYLFNRPSEWTYRDWRMSKARHLLDQIGARAIFEYVWFKDMTSEEKADHPEAEITGGYLRKQDISERNLVWWRGLSDDEKATIKAIPNFDAAIFKEITGIDIFKN